MINRLSLIVIGALIALSASAQEKPKAYIVSDAHFDSQWNWDVQTSIREYIPKTLNTNLMLLAKYPNYVFNFEGGVKYAWMKEYYPHEYEMIKQYIKQGRWHIAGASWDANDPNIPSPESFIRNVMYGQHFYRREFGVLSTDIFLPDCFGFGWTLPTIANHCGLIGFSTQKLQWRNHPFYATGKKIPFEIGLWQGVDGARIMCIADAHNYTSKWNDGEDLTRNKQLKKYIEDNRADGVNAVYHYYGTGDTGGSPTIGSVRAVERSVGEDGDIEVISATSDQIFKDYLPYDKHSELPVFDGELLMDVHGTGCYTSQAAMKWYNRRNEQLAVAAEGAAVVADWFGAVDYPTELLAEAWKRFVWHQFHDDLTGTSLPRAYEFSWNDELLSLKQFAGVLTTSVGAVARNLNTQVGGTPLVLYNPIGFDAADMIEVTLNTSRAISGVRVIDENGRRVKAQVVSNAPGSAKILIAASVPALGYAVYDIRPSYGKQKTLADDANTIENSIYRLTLDDNGDIASLIDKRNGKQMVAEGKAFRLALFTSNISKQWPAWEIIRSEMEKEPQSIGNARISLVENGELRTTLRVERSFGAGGSSIVQYISLNEGGQADRIDIYNEIDWKETNSLLKVEFPMAFANSEATYDLGIGAVNRGNNTDTAYEVISQQWTDLSAADGSCGLTVLNDGKYGWDKPDDNTIRLTLLHTPGTGNNYYQTRQDQGKHHFTYSLVAHNGALDRSLMAQKAELLNQGIKGFIADKHRGSLGKSYAFARGNNANVALRALKKAEDGSGDYVVRFFETSGEGSQNASFTFPAEIVGAQEVNGIEDNIGAARYSGNTLNFEIGRYGIKTFRVRLARATNVIAKIDQKPLELPFNAMVSSYNAFRNTVNLDGRGNSYAAELMPESLTYRGITFNLGNPDTRNGVKCEGQEIAIPAGYSTLYLLAAATARDTNTEVTFAGGSKGEVKQVVSVPVFNGFIGQWGHYNHTEAYIKPAEVAYVGTHHHNMMKGDLYYEFAYMFMIPVAVPQGATTLKLPENSRIVIFAATLANDANNTLTPATDLMEVNLPVREIKGDATTRKNLLVGKPCIERSGEVNRRESAAMAVDAKEMTKWCDNRSDSRTKFVAFDLGEVHTLRGWDVLNATLENLNYTSKEYSLQVKENETDEWTTVDTVTDNTDMETDRLLPEPVKARYVRLYITKPDQSEGFTARIYEFQVY